MGAEDAATPWCLVLCTQNSVCFSGQHVIVTSVINTIQPGIMWKLTEIMRMDRPYSTECPGIPNMQSTIGRKPTDAFRSNRFSCLDSWPFADGVRGRQ